MKKMFKILAVAVALCIIFASGCTVTNSADREIFCKLVLSDGVGFRCSQPIAEVKKGESHTFEMTLANGYEVANVDYADYTLSPESDPDENGERQIALTLNNVRYSANVELEMQKTQTANTVTINKSAFYECDEYTKITERGVAMFELYFDKDYTFGGIKENVRYDERGSDSMPVDGKRKVILTFKGIGGATSLNIEAVAFGNSYSLNVGARRIKYDLNGGSFNDGFEGGSYSVGYVSTSRNRPNTHLGAGTISREGYNLIGWNTKSDASGTHIGLGSRAEVQNGKLCTLYAEWSKHSPHTHFRYELVARDDVKKLYDSQQPESLENIKTDERENSVAIITSYSGAANYVTVPDKIDGIEVGGIMKNAFYSISTLRKVTLPHTLQFIGEAAFYNCNALKEITLSDGLKSVYENSFGYNPQITTINLNASSVPLYVTTENGQLANKIELLLNDKSAKPKLVFFAGCSIWYGVNAREVGEVYNKYSAFNTGVIGGTCALYQLDLLLSCMRGGDVLVHMPEPTSIYQFLCNADCDARVFTTLEANYDLISRLDWTRYTKVWPAFAEYISSRKTLLSASGYVPQSYEDEITYSDAYGDYIKYRDGGFDNEGERYNLVQIADLTGYKAVEKLDSCYRRFTDKGIDVLFGYGPTNLDGLSYSSGVELENYLKKEFAFFKTPIEMFMPFSAAVMQAKYFFDTNYHLSTEGAKLFTADVIQRIGQYL